MSGGLDGLSRKMAGARDLSSVVRSMKALAASSIGQYERAVGALHEYTQAVEFALSVCLREAGLPASNIRSSPTPVGLVVLGADQGLVGRFNDALMEFLLQEVDRMSAKVGGVWAVGARIEQLIAQTTLPSPVSMTVPYSVEAITPLVGELLLSLDRSRDLGAVEAIYLVHNKPIGGGTYGPVLTRLLPLDAEWQRQLMARKWPTRQTPQTVDGFVSALPALIRSHLFVTIFEACAQSLASENASRLAAMQRAEQNIKTMLQDLGRQYHRMRQTSIDEGLFEVVAGYESQSKQSHDESYDVQV